MSIPPRKKLGEDDCGWNCPDENTVKCLSCDQNTSGPKGTRGSLPEKSDLPEKYVTIIALLAFPDVPPVPLTGFIAETSDTHEPYFHAFGRCGYDVSLIAKWDYLADVLPGYSLPTNHHKNMEK